MPNVNFTLNPNQETELNGFVAQMTEENRSHDEISLVVNNYIAQKESEQSSEDPDDKLAKLFTIPNPNGGGYLPDLTQITPTQLEAWGNAGFYFDTRSGQMINKETGEPYKAEEEEIVAEAPVQGPAPAPIQGPEPAPLAPSGPAVSDVLNQPVPTAASGTANPTVAQDITPIDHDQVDADLEKTLVEGSEVSYTTPFGVEVPLKLEENVLVLEDREEIEIPNAVHLLAGLDESTVRRFAQGKFRTAEHQTYKLWKSLGGPDYTDIPATEEEIQASLVGDDISVTQPFKNGTFAVENNVVVAEEL